MVDLDHSGEKVLKNAVTPFVEHWLRTVLHCDTTPSAGRMRTDTVLCIGTGKNAACFSKLNERLGLFERIIALAHPRYVMQYKARSMEVYIDKYLAALEAAREPIPAPTGRN
jgi:hypothetical protein